MGFVVNRLNVSVTGLERARDTPLRAGLVGDRPVAGDGGGRDSASSAWWCDTSACIPKRRPRASARPAPRYRRAARWRRPPAGRREGPRRAPLRRRPPPGGFRLPSRAPPRRRPVLRRGGDPGRGRSLEPGLPAPSADASRRRPARPRCVEVIRGATRASRCCATTRTSVTGSSRRSAARDGHRPRPHLRQAGPHLPLERPGRDRPPGRPDRRAVLRLPHRAGHRSRASSGVAGPGSSTAPAGAGCSD